MEDPAFYQMLALLEALRNDRPRKRQMAIRRIEECMT